MRRWLLVFTLGWATVQAQYCPNGHPSCASYERLKAAGFINAGDLSCFEERDTIFDADDQMRDRLGQPRHPRSDTFDVFSYEKASNSIKVSIYHDGVRTFAADITDVVVDSDGAMHFKLGDKLWEIQKGGSYRNIWDVGMVRLTESGVCSSFGATTLSNSKESRLPTPSPSTESRQQFGRVTVTSTREPADVYVDSKFVGNTPATLKLTSGSHDIAVNGPNNFHYQRTIEVLPDSDLVIHADTPPSHSATGKNR